MNIHSGEWIFIGTHAQDGSAAMDFHSCEWKSIRGGSAADDLDDPRGGRVDRDLLAVA